MDSDAQRAMTSIERQGNPWGLNRKERENWRDAAPDAEIPTVKELKKKEKNLSTFLGRFHGVLRQQKPENRGLLCQVAQSRGRVLRDPRQ